MTPHSLLSELDWGAQKGTKRWRKPSFLKEEPTVPTIPMAFEQRGNLPKPVFSYMN